MQGSFGKGLTRATIARWLLAAMLAAAPLAASANEAARLMAEAVAEAANIPNGQARARAAIAIARIQAAAGLEAHARNALRQTAEAIWKATGAAGAESQRIGLLAETAEAQCALKLHADATSVLKTTRETLDKARAEAAVRLLRAALACGNRSEAGAIEATYAGRPSAAVALALARQGLPNRAESMADRLAQAARSASAAGIAAAVARLGYFEIADRLDPGAPRPPAIAALTDLLAQANARLAVGDRAGSAGFLAVAAGRIEEAPAFKPALAAAHADLGDIAGSEALRSRGGDSPEARAALARAYAQAGEAARARALLIGAEGVGAVAALAALARNDKAAAEEASVLAYRQNPGRQRAEALAHAAVARLNGG